MFDAQGNMEYCVNFRQMDEDRPLLGQFLAKADKFFNLPQRNGNELRRFGQSLGMGHITALEFEADYMDEYYPGRKHYRGN